MKKLKLNKKAYIVIGIVLIIIIVSIVMFLLLNNNRNKEFLGLWTIDGYTNYEFTTRDRGKLIIPSNDYPFDYEVEENTICIDYENEDSIDSCYEYWFKDENLYLKSKEGYEHKFSRIDKIEN